MVFILPTRSDVMAGRHRECLCSKVIETFGGSRQLADSRKRKGSWLVAASRGTHSAERPDTRGWELITRFV